MRRRYKHTANIEEAFTELVEPLAPVDPRPMLASTQAAHVVRP